MESTKNQFMVYAGISTAIYIVGELIDVGATYILSPDLALETNIMVRRYGFGWSYIVLSAFLSSIIMLLIQFWMWRRLFKCLPDSELAYKPFYRKILVGESTPSSGLHIKSYASGMIMAVAFIVAYAAIASKLITCGWNLMLLTASVEIYPLIVIMLVKNVFAAIFGILMFYVFPFLLHRRLNLHC